MNFTVTHKTKKLKHLIHIYNKCVYIVYGKI